MVNCIISIDIYARLGWSRSARQAVAEGSQVPATLRRTPSRWSARTLAGLGLIGGAPGSRPPE
jgi:hypothetical protein